MADGAKKKRKIKRDGPFIMSSAWYTQMGNNPHTWSGSASQLFAASMILRHEREKERERVLTAETPVGLVSVALGTAGAERLLTAFALEALLKAVWLKTGHNLVAAGKYIGLPCERKGWHN